jgi:hypothetical protein
LAYFVQKKRKRVQCTTTQYSQLYACQTNAHGNTGQARVFLTFFLFLFCL